MRKQGLLEKAAMLVLAGAMMIGGTLTAYAATGQWKQNAAGWRWERLGGGYPTNAWVWIDGSNDGKAECCYFDSDGYMLANTTTPDGCTVNADGAWTENGVVQTHGTNSNLDDVALAGDVNAASASGVVTDGKSWPQITFDETLLKAYENNGISLLTNLTPTEPKRDEGSFGLVYAMQSKGKTISVDTSTNYNRAVGYFGPVGAFFNNFPEQGIELNAFYDNTGYEDPAWRRKPAATTGSSDMIFNLPQGSYRMGYGSVGNTLIFQILLTAGDDGKWYIYSDSPMHTN